MMEFLKHKKIYTSIFLISLLLTILSWVSINYLKEQRDELAYSKQVTQIEFMKENLHSLILQKQKATIAIALTIANDSLLSNYVSKKTIEEKSYIELIENFKKHTLYQNIWVQILDDKGTSLYRSWSDKRNDNLFDIREDLKDISKSQKISYSISVGKFDISLKAMVPIFHNEKFVGVLEMISHFNSISNQLKLHEIDSVVLLKKEYKERLEYPFTKLFLDDYYIANFNAPLRKREYLKRNGVEKYFNDSYKIENGYLIASYPLKGSHNNTLGYYIMFKKVASISSLDVDFMMFKSIASIIISIMAIAILFSTAFYYKNKKQRKYYKRIIDSSSNIVIINNNELITSVNKIFFRYFKQYRDFEEFTDTNECICDFFVEEEGCLNREMDGLFWINYLVIHPDEINKVKVDIEGVFHYFSVSASLVLKEREEYSVILSDITLAENYKNELEKLTITDALTGIGNRRFFHQKMREEISRAKRYEHELSVIMLDIDYFKKVNDSYGHDVGDEVLKEYTKFIASYLRDVDIFSRIGGEEFIIILPYTNRQNAIHIAQKLRAAIEESKKIVPITMSFGVTEYIKGEDMEFIFKRVDSALYEAKHSGRNKVVSA